MMAYVFSLLLEIKRLQIYNHNNFTADAIEN